MRTCGWILLWIAASLAVHLLSVEWQNRALLTNDGYQYLDAAGHLLTQKALVTSVAHFDEQLAWGRFPVPLTHFPPGYPLAIAMVGVFGFSLPFAAYLLSIVGYIAVTLLIADACRSLNAGPFVTAMLCVLWIGNSYALLFSTTLGPGALFIACTTAFAALLLRDLKADGGRPSLLVFMGVAIGAAFALRYAALFFIPSLGMYLAWRAWRTPRTWRWAMGGAVAAALFIVPILVRNSVVTGSWKGGHSNGKSHPVSEVVHEFVTAPFHITLGDNARLTVDVWAMLLVAAACVLAVALAGQARTVRLSRPGFTLPALFWLAVMGGGYAAGIILTELTTIAAATHYYLPVYPLALMAAGAGLRRVASLMSRVALAACVICVLVINARSVANPRPEAPDGEVARLLNQPVEPGIPLKAWLKTRLRPCSVLVSTNGQAVYFVLRQPVVSIIDGGSSSREWNSATLRQLMEHYGAEYLLVFPGADPYAVLEQYNIPLFHELAGGGSLPWLHIAARVPGVIVYQCSECGRAALSAAGESDRVAAKP